MKNIIVPLIFPMFRLMRHIMQRHLQSIMNARIILFHSFPLTVPDPGMPYLFPDIDDMIVKTQ